MGDVHIAKNAHPLAQSLFHSGQVYAGKYLAGIVSLLAVAGTAYGYRYFQERGEWGNAAACGFFAALFYAGNVYGAYNSALDANRQFDDTFNRAFRARYLPQYAPLCATDERALFQ